MDIFKLIKKYDIVLCANIKRSLTAVRTSQQNKCPGSPITHMLRKIEWQLPQNCPLEEKFGFLGYDDVSMGKWP
jgi:hypothetical protein